MKTNTGLVKRTKSNIRKNFLIVRNNLLQNKNISFESKGLLLMMLSLPDDFIIHKTWIMKEYKIGKHKINKMFKELEENGYLASLEMLVKDGRFIGRNYMIYESPENNVAEISPFSKKNDTVSDFPSTENPPTEIPPTEKQYTKKNIPLQRTEIKKEHTLKKGDDVFFSLDECTFLLQNKEMVHKSQLTEETFNKLFDWYSCNIDESGYITTNDRQILGYT